MRIVIAEDHEMFRDILRKVCVTECDCAVVGEAGSGRCAKRLIKATRPDLVILDLHLPDGDGFEVAEFTRSRWPSIRILMVSSHCDDYTLFLVERAGALGFVDKNTESVKTLAKAIEALRQGQAYFSHAFHEAAEARATDPHNFLKLLSERERTALTLFGDSLSDVEIAGRLGISPTTVQTHRSHIIRKLGLANSLELVRYAIKHGFTRVATQRNGKPVLP